MTQIPPNRTKYLRVVVAETAPTVEHSGPGVEERDSVDDPDAASLDGDAQRAFNPEDFIEVALPSGGWARVSPDVTPETLTALDRLMQAAVWSMLSRKECDREGGEDNTGRDEEAPVRLPQAE